MPISRLASYLPLRTAVALLAISLAACDDDNNANTGSGGKGGTPGSGGKGGTPGSGGKGGTPGSAGTTGLGGTSDLGGNTGIGGAAGGSAGSIGGGGSAGTTGVGGSAGTTAVGGAGTAGAGGRAGSAGTAGVGGAGTAGAGGRAGAGGSAPAAFVDTDVVLARFNADGTRDTTFGTNGIARVDLGPGALVGTSNLRDALWGVSVDDKDRLVLFGARKSTGAGRVDTDRVVVRLSPNGAVDTTFGTAGFNTLSIGTLSDNARNGIVQPDGKILSAGYTGQPTGVGTQNANKVVLLRLHGGDAAPGAGGAGGASGAGGAGGAAAPAPGTPDNTFGYMGIVNYNPFDSGSPSIEWGLAEAYGIARQSTGAYVTAGYGRMAPTGTVNVVSFRFTPAGLPDNTWATGGIFEKDLTGDNDRARNLVTLPGDRVLFAGSATPTASNVDGMLMIVTPNGQLDTNFNTTGYKVYSFDRGDEAFYGVAASPNGLYAAAAGYRNTNTAVAGTNDDATLVILPLGATGTEFAAPVPLSTTTNDRFWAVTFDATNKPVATGYVSEAGDNALAVARFNLDGTFDTTFGTGGIAKVNAAVGTNLEEARGVVIQANGKIVIAGVAEK